MIDIIHDDLVRFSKLRSWYRYLPLAGKNFLIFPWKGQQPRNVFNPDVTDTTGIHWWAWEADFIDEIPISGIGKDIIMRRPVTFNSFLRGLDGDANDPYLKGLDVIKNNNPDFSTPKPIKHAHKEHKRQIDEAIRVAIEIHKLMTEQAPEWLDTGLDNAELSDEYIELSPPASPRPKARRTKSELNLTSKMHHHHLFKKKK